jgi:NAD-dependent DNA ligase
MKDRDGQPGNKRFNSRLRQDRETDELIGLCKGIVSDGEVNQAEAEFLSRWLDANRETENEWPSNVLRNRVCAMLDDGKLDSDEEGELLKLLLQVTGGNPALVTAENLSSSLPLNAPPPTLVFPGNVYCFTGKSIWGTRRQCQAAVLDRGGEVQESIAQSLNYLIVGVIGSRDWIHTTYGRKIQKAVEYRDKGVPLAIVSEEHFVTALDA